MSYYYYYFAFFGPLNVLSINLIHYNWMHQIIHYNCGKKLLGLSTILALN